ncbi:MULTISPECIES: bifunctional UDP-N-acetylglucosamine diphosphorylase/glucosamine-1-phosphate N-acetyltransferase GlmU [Fusobacterium]|jgi:bifunctional UDP-N-acetylglucosamine pyrophosphorylase/glucosamine-1-phosphate N-acetyltransferase|uniref:Bifunctional protein GlmU n=1 Tax=Fusobacterium ulcerans 12-1B TaxID=457404 RepID=H1PVC9_9FUSO|nr:MULTISPECIES: bifunctional UDP-N-acetylglucosamine diphosphorylase/glucosamine-1-phosphate N-acetyltransferase GlmU [Fusobacterium]EHO80106.1 UDP-N-acetylglucosamine diphosphorylase/glucosamine-1-phosphate N-acetyltransferase [Fusobacterium ulcerans 12-1B]MCB8563441.1 bifunctional UDP-N-acetylglucosamine diphosphorylase/glucosamine-1-phosphate N-acetyltransferase GlmU [Fusobacterium ulcerans]MCB8647708.1 bifunctional UDP-N-acetylglucosamine diphosphorylase/glucosamine-1-phosphate N-acetyltran
MKLKTLILAAGKGTRMKSELPKVIHEVNGIPMISKIIKVLEVLKPEENILILGHKKEEVLKVVGEDADYVVQTEQLGTGHAVLQAKDKLKDYDGDVMVLCGDTPLLREETLEELYKFHRDTDSVTTILTSIYDNPFGYGRIVKENGLVKAIVEEKEADAEIKKIKEVNAGVYCFKGRELFDALSKITNNNEKGEYYLTDVIGIQVGEGKKVQSFVLNDNIEILGVNSKVELAQASKVLRDRKNIDLMEKGAILIDPSAVYAEEDVVVGRDTVIYPGAILQGKTVIGENCQILGTTRIIDSTLGNDIKVESSVIEESILEDGVTMGPFAHLRPKSHLKEKVHVGNFVEVKKSTLEKGVKAGHLTYLGDAQIGEDTNIGAGTITCNYDGKNKFKTVIGKNSFIGSDSMLVAPVIIGENALVGAGSVITKDVPDNSLAVSRSKQIIKNDWRK